MIALFLKLSAFLIQYFCSSVAAKPRFRLRVFLVKGFSIWLLTSTR
ncbi:hypothetical protein Hdeb2414_s0007g00229971 [Helianthus debilis subsp. tardiflorus]